MKNITLLIILSLMLLPLLLLAQDEEFEPPPPIENDFLVDPPPPTPAPQESELQDPATVPTVWGVGIENDSEEYLDSEE